MKTAFLALTVLLTSGAPVAAQSLLVTGPDGRNRTFSAADLAALPHEDVTLQQAGHAIRYEGAPLTLLLQAVGAPAGKALHGPELADIVIVSAADGYRVALALAETDPAMRADKVLLADRADGGPLPAGEGPFRLVVEGDLRAARSVRMVTAIAVTRAP